MTRALTVVEARAMMAAPKQEYDVDVDIRGTVRVMAADEEEALDAADTYVQTGTDFDVHSVYPVGTAREV